MEKWKCSRVDGPQEAYHVGLMNSYGYRTKDLRKPITGIVNSYTDANPGCKPLRELVKYVKEGVWCAGGASAEFNVPAPCDGMSHGEGMHYILPRRELIADFVEAIINANSFDGLMFLRSCDKIVPGMLMAAVSLNKPCMFLTAGSMLPYEGEERTYVTPNLKESIGERNVGSISEDTFTVLEENICSSCETCSIYGTANTMGVFSEVIGLTPMDSTTMPYCSAAKYRQAKNVGEWIVALAKEGVTFSHIVTENSLINGLRHISAIGGSNSAQLHMCAITETMDLNLDMRWFDEIQRDVPCIAKFKPPSQYSIYNYYKASGVRTTLKSIRDYLNLDEELATGGALKEYLDKFNKKVDKAIIHNADDPLYPDRCFAVLTGDLAPKECVIKKNGVEPSVFFHRGPTVCFDSEEDLRDYMVHKTIRPGSVLVIRHEGPKDGPGIQELSIPAVMLVRMGLHMSVTMMTDERFSGTTRKPCVGYTTPEAWEGDPIAAVEDGDIITIDLDNRSINVEFTQEETSDRLKRVRRPDHPAKGIAKAFHFMVSGADKGAIWLYKEKQNNGGGLPYEQ